METYPDLYHSGLLVNVAVSVLTAADVVAKGRSKFHIFGSLSVSSTA
jgi:hypothetical protein